MVIIVGLLTFLVFHHERGDPPKDLLKALNVTTITMYFMRGSSSTFMDTRGIHYVYLALWVRFCGLRLFRGLWLWSCLQRLGFSGSGFRA